MDVRKKVLIDLFASPTTLLPVVGGLSSLIFSWATGGEPVLNFLGVVGVLGGLGVMATKLVFGLEKITNEAYRYVQSQKLEQQKDALDQLDHKLRTDRDPRTQGSLRELRTLCSTFAQDVKKSKIARSAGGTLEIVQELFRACVVRLEHSYQLWQRARSLSGQARKNVLQEREKVIGEVVDAVKHLAETIEQFGDLTSKRNEGKLDQLREELDEAMRVAQRTEERLASWEDPSRANTELE